MIDTLFDTFNSQVPKMDLSFNLLNISEIFDNDNLVSEVNGLQKIMNIK